MASSKYIKVGEEGKMIAVTECYVYAYDHGDGKTVLRLTIPDTNITVGEVLTLFNNEANLPISEYLLTTPAPELVTDTSAAQYLPTVDPVYQLVSVHEEFCKDMAYEYKSHAFSIEITKKLAEERLSEENQQTNNEIMLAIADMYDI